MGRDLQRVRLEIRAARRATGLSFEALGGACGVTGSTAARVVSGETSDPNLSLLAAMSAAVGLELRLRAFPGGDPLRDAGQLRLLERLRLRLHPSLGWRTEVPLPIIGDLRAWDAAIQSDAWWMAVDAETVLDDLQAVDRRITLKIRDSDTPACLLVIADTRRNRRALASAPSAFAGFSRDSRSVLRALGTGTRPLANAIVLL